jgi:hypothetical protein
MIHLVAGSNGLSTIYYFGLGACCGVLIYLVMIILENKRK